ncbi:shikimate kinase [Bacillus timonensis]|uniref:shikimate kinase n=1 Tax=Bacillus timonensis TaxID=1033734 RepID=UPI000288ADEF|nr:shikimate kinase [Bacillus timonensis]
MKAIYLTGFMGAGKTTIGAKLGEALHLPVIDTDQFIEEKVGKRIADIFSENGEQTFREYERSYLKEIPTSDIVITTGGGIVIQEENRQWMLENGHVIFLYCDIEKIFERVQIDPARPLFDTEKKENTIKLYNERMPFYNEAHYKLDTTEKNLAEVVTDILSWLHTQKGGNNN